jgi:UDP-N-acetylbacillosamine N-acetyltransferase
MKVLYIFGATGHGEVLADIADVCGYDEIIFLDDENPKHPSLSDIGQSRDVPIALGILSNQRRSVMFQKLVSEGFKIATLIHPSAVISKSAHIGQGSVVMPGVIVNSGAYVGEGVILNSGSIIENGCKIENFAHISPSASLASNVYIAPLAHIGIGASIIQDMSVGRESIVGAGSVVVSHIPPNTVSHGVPCKVQKERK